MRSIRKPWSPNDVSREGEPRTLKAAEEAYLQVLPHQADRTDFARASFEELDKTKLRAVLYAEQGDLCVYCERQLEEQWPFPHVAHWHALSAHPDLALHWANLHGSCTTSDTCDGWQKARSMCLPNGGGALPFPKDHAYERSVGFTSLGEVYPRPDARLDASQSDALAFAIGPPYDPSETAGTGILNLNHPALVAARQAALDSERSRMQSDYPDATATKAGRSARASELLDERPLRSHVSIRVAWLTKTWAKATP